jgi:hypothetical protein
MDRNRWDGAQGEETVEKGPGCELDPAVKSGGGATRRLFLRGSLMVGVPLMLTLKSRTVLGGGNDASGNLSGCSGTGESAGEAVPGSDPTSSESADRAQTTVSSPETSSKKGGKKKFK